MEIDTTWGELETDNAVWGMGRTPTLTSRPLGWAGLGGAGRGEDR